MSIRIRHIYFDIGNVLFDVSHSSAWTMTLRASNLDEKTAFSRFYDWGAPIEHMTGKMTDSQFFSEMKTRLEYLGSSTTLKYVWSSVFHPNLSRIEQASQFLKEISCGLISNISPCHSEFIENQSDVISRFFPRIYSWRCGYMKPRVEIFEESIRSCRFDPDEILFIDDQMQHCECARGLGMHTIHLNPGESISDRFKASGYYL